MNHQKSDNQIFIDNDGIKSKILLVDDSEADGITLRRLIKDDYTITQVFDEDEAIDAVRRELPDCVLIDYRLVKATGIEVLDKLIHLDLGKPVAFIVLTGHESISLALEAMKTGAHDFLSKNDLNKDKIGRSIKLAIRNAELAFQVKYLAYHDTLTGLPNRKIFWQRLNHHIATSQSKVEPFAVIYVDIDRFKQINDSYGHHIGDRVLAEVAKRISLCVQGRDIVSRLGGDEFGVILHDIVHQEHATVVADRIRDLLTAPFEIESRELSVTASLGVSMYPANGENPDEIVRSSDLAMYRVKKDGGNKYRVFTEAMRTEVQKRLLIEQELSQALGRGQFVIHYQPIVNRAEHVVALEALLRWERPGVGLVSPLDFIPLLEETRQIIAVEHWVLATVCKQYHSWIHKGLGPLRVHVNLSPIQFEESGIEHTIRDTLRCSNLAPGWLELEITESSVIKDVDRCIQAVHSLQELGVQVSLDDFGMGYSSLSALARLPIRGLKIDRSFLRGLPDDSGDVGIVQAIIAMARSLNMHVIAEGVENTRQLVFLETHYCDYFQGYLFSQPLPAEQVTQLLQRQTLQVR